MTKVRGFFKGLPLLFVGFSMLLIPVGHGVHGESPIGVAIFPFQFQARESLDYLQDAVFVTLSRPLVEERRIEVLDRGRVREALAGTKDLMDDDHVRKIARELGVDYAITGNLTKDETGVDLHATLVSIGTPAPSVVVSKRYENLDAAMDGLAEFADRARRRIVLTAVATQETEEPSEDTTIGSAYESTKEAVGLSRPAPPKPTRGLETLQTLPTFIRGVGVGDVDGDRLNEIVLIDEKNLWIYKERDGRLRLLRKIQGHRNDAFLTLDVADINKNGLAEIVVTNMRSTVLRSFILEFEENRIKKIMDRESWFFRVIHKPREGPILVGQKMGVSRHPAGGIYAFAWDGKAFVPTEARLMEKTIPVFSFDVGDVDGGGEERVVYVDYHDFLQVVDAEGSYLWESGQKYGGSDIFYALAAGGQEKSEKRVYIPGRLLIRDVNGDDVPEVLVSHNDFKLRALEKLRVYDRARLVLLSWQGMGLVENWKTPDIAGYISDYQIRDVDNDGQEEAIMAAVSKRALTGKASSAVLVYELF